MTTPEPPRRLAVGAAVLPDGVAFRVWAPKRRRVEVVIESGPAVELAAEGGGYFSGRTSLARAGSRYRYRLDGGGAFPDPASRFQPEGPHGPSQVVDPAAFPWADAGWRGAGLAGQVIYEMHIGTFTPEGTWAAAARELPELAGLGVTALEVMPVADFPGRFGWGYDGVNLFAPTRLYGTPDDMRRFVDAAHRLGLAVVLDVVYNHLGPDGNYLRQYADAYFTNRHSTDWGEALQFDGPDAGPVRDYFLANAAYWIDEFHIDGLRLDATQAIHDASADHILAAIGRAVRTAAAANGGRRAFLIAENEPQQLGLVRPAEDGGHGLDGLWNDDFHHAARVALTGKREGYYSDYFGSPQELISAAKRGCLFQGQRHAGQRRPRGSPGLDLPPETFVNFLQNHDQVANTPGGRRLQQLTSPGRLRALTALLLLGPGTPMLFQGQEFAASAPFPFFADHGPDLARRVARGRADYLAVFASQAARKPEDRLPNPADPAVFASARLDLSERRRHAPVYALHRDLLTLRREDAVFRAPRPGGVDGAVLGPQALVLRFLGGDDDDRLLLLNLGPDLHLEVAPEPLLAPPEGRRWRTLWTSEDPRYGGGGGAPLDPEAEWRLPGEAAVVLGAL